MKKLTTGGGWASVRYVFRKAQEAGGIFRMWRALRSKNACKTCALGMGGQRGGMVNESGHFPEVCKKSVQAMTADMQGKISDDFFKRYSIEQLKQLSPRELESLGRIASPLYAGPGDSHYRPISWSRAFDRMTDQLKSAIADENFFYMSGRSSNEAAFLLQLFARQYGTNNVNNCSYYCHQASGVGLGSTLGSGTATIVLDDLEHSDLVFLIGGNPASNHPRLMRSLMQVRRRGGDVIVVNPIAELGLKNFSIPSDIRSLLFGSEIASLFVQPHIGGDIALLMGIAKVLDERGRGDQSFIDQHTVGYDAFIEYVRLVEYSELEACSGVSRDVIACVAEKYSAAKNVVFAWTMGITHHLHGVDNVRAIVNLALMRGMVGRKHAGLLPIRGHSNVQGIGSVGVTPALKSQFFENLEGALNVKLPVAPGLDTLGCLEAMHDGLLKGGWCLGGNLYGASPHADWAAEAFSKLELLTYISTTLNTGHAFATGRETLILPARVRDEESQKTTQESMFNYVRVSDGGPARLDGPLGEVEIVSTVAARVCGQQPVDWEALKDHAKIRTLIARVVPGFGAITQVDRDKREFQIKGRTFHQPQFNTPDGRARFSVTPLPPAQKLDGELLLMTIRSEGQFNTVVYEEEDVYRHQDSRNIILMNIEDINRLSLRENQRVTVESNVGSLQDVVVRPFDIRSGNAAMYFPEANVLVPYEPDSESRTPAYKAVCVRVYPDRSKVSLEVAESAMASSA